MKTTMWSLGILGYLSVMRASGSETTNTPPISPTYPTNSVLFTYTPKSTTLIDRWPQEMVPTGSRIIYERYDIPSKFMWIEFADVRRYEIHDFFSNYGKRTTYKILGDAARESAVETLPLDDYADTWSHWGGQLWTRLIHGSIGNTEEEDIRTVSSTPSYNSLRHIIYFEWNDDNGGWDGQYGWRFWRDNPYVYVNNDLGHYAGRQFVRTEVRCYGYLRPNSFGIIKTEATAIMTLSENSQLVFGGFLYPFENEKKYRPQGSIRFEMYRNNCLISLGTESTIRGISYNITTEFRF